MSTQPKPLVSIGIPTYNRPQQLHQALANITAQTYPHLEVIVSDNCSPGSDTQRVAESFIRNDDRIRYVRQTQNIGMFQNFKSVFEASNGAYFTWLADDDTRSEHFIERCMRIFEQPGQSPNLLLVNAYSHLIQPHSKQVLRTDKGCTTVGLSPAARYHKYLSSIYTDQGAIGDLIYGVIKREAVYEAFSAQPNILGWDRVFLCALALKGEFYTIPEPLMYSAPGGMSTLGDASKMAEIQCIHNSLYIRKARWVRTFFLQQLAWCANNLSLFSKVRLSVWLFFRTLFRIP